MTAWTWSVFVLGLASGAWGAVFTEYLRVSPRWFRWALTVSAVGVVGRYVLLVAAVATPEAALGWSTPLMAGWAAVGLTLPCAAAVDQLVRHPAMTPKKVVRLYAPWGVGLAGLAAAGPIGSAIGHTAFALAIAWVTGLLIRKVPADVHRPLAGLAGAQVILAGRHVAAVFVPLNVPVLLVTDLLVLASIWAALKTARVSA